MADEEGVAQSAQKAGESRERLIDDLEAVDDYWLSVTDAARVTRRQEITIRRWIAVGDLPVRRQRMGLNKRTRHVRASDLAKLTPIIDPTAAITGNVGNLDLANIPVQQAELLTTQQELVQRLSQYEQALAELVARREEDRRHQATIQQDALARLEQDLLVQLAILRQDMGVHSQHLEDALHTQQTAWQTTVQDIARQLAQETAARQVEHEQLTGVLSAQAAALRQAETLQQQMQDHREQAQRGWQQRFEEQAAVLQEALEHLRVQMMEGFQEQLADVTHAWQTHLTQFRGQAALRVTHWHAEQQRRRWEDQARQRAVRWHLTRPLPKPQ